MHGVATELDSEVWTHMEQLWLCSSGHEQWRPWYKAVQQKLLMGTNSSVSFFRESAGPWMLVILVVKAASVICGAGQWGSL